MRMASINHSFPTEHKIMPYTVMTTQFFRTQHTQHMNANNTPKLDRRTTTKTNNVYINSKLIMCNLEYLRF